jgi:hypothetical protein
MSALVAYLVVAVVAGAYMRGSTFLVLLGVASNAARQGRCVGCALSPFSRRWPILLGALADSLLWPIVLPLAIYGTVGAQRQASERHAELHRTVIFDDTDDGPPSGVRGG